MITADRTQPCDLCSTKGRRDDHPALALNRVGNQLLQLRRWPIVVDRDCSAAIQSDAIEHSHHEPVFRDLAS